MIYLSGKKSGLLFAVFWLYPQRPPGDFYSFAPGKKLVPLKVPSLIVFGDKGVVSSVVAEELQRLNPRLQAEQIREANHSVHLDQPERFAAVVGSFIRSIGTIIDS